MKKVPEPIGEWDLQAYADGQLDRDPVRRRQVEEWLRNNPEEARRFWDYHAQNVAIAERYAGVVDEPVPSRLHEALELRRSAGSWARAAAFAAILLASGGIGWWIGFEGSTNQSPALRFAALLSEASRPSGTAGINATASGHLAGASAQIQPLGWLSEQITIPLHLPDLTPFGYTPVDRRLVESNAGEAVEVTYAGPDRKPVVLLIAPRWQDETSELELVERDGLRIVYGFKGPLGYGVAGDMDEDTIRLVAEAVRRSWERRPAGNTAAIGMEPGASPLEPVRPMAAHPQAIRGDGRM